MGKFRNDLLKKLAEGREDLRHLPGRLAVRVQNGMKFGDPVTGAPGQPIEEGALRNSYHITFRKPGVSFIVSSDKPYARTIEYGVGPHGRITLATTHPDGRPKTPKGGFHSRDHIVSNFGRLVADELEAMKAGAPPPVPQADE